MRITYLLYFDISRESGVAKKILRQVIAWEALGATVKIHVVTSNNKIWEALNVLDITVYHCRYKLDRVTQFNKATAEILEWNPTLVYLRAGLYFYSHVKLAQKIPTVVEVNTDEISEKQNTLGFLKFHYYQWMRKKLNKRAVGFVCVTYELKNSIAEFGKKSITISNSIDLSLYPDPILDNKNKVIRAIYLGTGAENNDWNGIDKIVRLARSAPEITFDLVGSFRRERFGDATSNVIFHGFMSTIDYGKLLANANVSIGSLALHRKNMDEACPLKVREYFANGLPVIMGYKDSDFLESYDFIYQIENTESNVDDNIDGIRSFCSDWLGKRVPRSEIAHLDTSVKERQRMEFFVECGSTNE